MNGTNGVITDAGHTQRRIHGNYEIALNLPVDGGFSIGVRAANSPHRYDELCFVTADVHTANLAYRVIAEGADNGVKPEGIRAALDSALRAELLRVQRRHDAPSRQRIEHINALLDLMESPVDTAEVAELADTLRQPAQPTEQAQPARPRNFAELRDMHAAAAAADRADRKRGA